jgi:hypothetical protein
LTRSSSQHVRDLPCDGRGMTEGLTKLLATTNETAVYLSELLGG